MKKSFTLIELLIVIVIIGILASLATTPYKRLVRKARAAEAKQELRAVADYIWMTYVETGNFPCEAPNSTIRIDITDSIRPSWWTYPAIKSRHFFYYYYHTIGYCMVEALFKETGPGGTDRSDFSEGEPFSYSIMYLPYSRYDGSGFDKQRMNDIYYRAFTGSKKDSTTAHGTADLKRWD